MPHKMYQESLFYDKAAELKARFTVDAKDSLFLNDADQKNIPLDGLHVYIDKSWESIKDQKELNLPDQREMVANYRCIELKEEALQLVEPAIRELQKQCDNAYVKDFYEQTMTIMTKASNYYADVAKQYDRSIFAKIKKELIASLL